MLAESPLVGQATEKALSAIRKCDGDGARVESADFPDFPGAKAVGSFVYCPKRPLLFRSVVKLRLLSKEQIKPSRHDLALAGNMEAMPKEVSVPSKALALAQEALARAMEFTSILDSLSLALGNAMSGSIPEPAMSPEQAVPVLLQAVDSVAQNLMNVLSGAYVNSLLVQRDALLKRSTLPPSFKASLRAAPVSAEGLFGSVAKAAVEESAKRTTDQAFAAIARQGKRPQFYQSQSGSQPKRPRTSGSYSARKEAKGSKHAGRPFSYGRGRGRGAYGGPAPKKPSKGVSPL
jgi:hypothetical protein